MGEKVRECDHCGRGTREGKPFCPLHVESNLYVADLIHKIAEAEEEAAKISSGRGIRVDPRGSMAKELMVKLVERNGTASIARLSRDLARDDKAVGRVVRALVHVGMVWTKPSERGGTIVSINEEVSRGES